MTVVDIKGLDKDTLLKALWTRLPPESFFIFNGIPPPSFNLVEAKSQLHDGYADYVCGRIIKADIYNEDIVDSFSYDRDNGEGVFAEVVASLRGL